MTDQRALLSWRGEVPVSERHGDPYYSLDDGAAEAAHVYLAGNGLPERFRDGFTIAELGFGVGLNLCVAWAAARAAGTSLRYAGFEAHPVAPDEMARALAAFPAVRDEARALVTAWAEGPCLALPGLTACIEIGPAQQTLPHWSGKADAWFLDGFAPARNPDLWSVGLLREVAAHTAPGGTAATYSAAGSVRRDLAAAGFTVERRAGFGRKRHMTAARLG